MKSILKWVAGIVGTALSLVLVIVLLPYAADLAEKVMPGIEAAAQRTAGELRHSMTNSRRLETIRVSDTDVVSNEFEIAGVVWGGISFRYEYKASYGIDLAKVELLVSGSTITMLLPEPELILDELVPSDVSRDDFWVRITDAEYERIMEREKLLCRDRYLSGDRREELWSATMQAMSETVSTWLTTIDPRITIEYAKLDAASAE